MSKTQTFTFHRHELAAQYCDSLEGKGLADSRSGLFLAAPRRTGKSTFLREDLLPEMQKRGWTTVYVDLWADKARDPALLITGAIKSKFASFASVVAKLAKASGLEKVNVFGALSLNLDSLELPVGLTLADALEALDKAGDAPVAIVIDEAQHALSTKAGVDAMFALKAARDHMNQGSGKQRLFIVLTGSNRDKLAHLVLKRDQPFFGSQVTKFPLLDKGFTNQYTDFVNPYLATSNQFHHEDMFEAFKLVGHRPEMLRHIVSEIALNAGAEHLRDDLKNGAEELKQRMWDSMESEFSSLTDIQQAVIKTMIDQNKDFAPFGEKSMRSYAALTNQEKVQIPSVQAALDTLREKGLVWRSAYGSYALEDESMSIWFKARQVAVAG